MIRRGIAVVVPAVLVAGGCVWDEPETTLVSPSPFNHVAAAPQRNQSGYKPAATEAAARGDMLGRKIIAANRQIGVRPLFRTIGAPQPEVFHNGTTDIDVTEGLVAQCKTEGELAAVLCRELGKMIAEREALADPRMRNPNQEPPQEVRVGNDNAGVVGSADQTHLAELGKFEQEHRRPTAPTLPPPDPQVLARNYLLRAGFTEKDFEEAAPVLQAAAANSTFEKQLTPQSPTRPWVH
jgi:hypothetical protein